MGAMSSYPVRTRRWTRKEYDRLIDLGILHEDEPIELLAGQMLVAEPKTPLDSTAIGLAGDALRVARDGGRPRLNPSPVALADAVICVETNAERVARHRTGTRLAPR